MCVMPTPSHSYAFMFCEFYLAKSKKFHGHLYHTYVCVCGGGLGVCGVFCLPLNIVVHLCLILFVKIKKMPQTPACVCESVCVIE